MNSNRNGKNAIQSFVSEGHYSLASFFLKGDRISIIQGEVKKAN
jgi:hypothetical protein